MSQQALISVIIPVYKVEKYLDKCVGSVVAQTYKNLEIILVDDGSPDKCPEMCDAWAKKDARIKVVHKQNGGLGDARNAGLNIASGEFIGFVDSDDWCELSMYEKMMESYQKYCKSIVVCDVWIDWENGWPSEKKCLGLKSPFWNSVETAEAFYCGELPSWMCNKLFVRSLWNGVRFNAQLYEDIPIMRSFMNTINGISFTHTLEYHYIQQQKSIVNSSIKESHLTLLYEMMDNYEAAKSVSEKAAVSARQELVSVAYFLLYKLVEQDALPEKQDEIIEVIRQNWNDQKNFKMSNAFESFVLKKIATGKRFRYLIRIHKLFKKLYFKLKIKEFIGAKR